MRQYRILWISLAVLILDQITKLIVKSTMSIHDSIPVLGNFFRLTYIENPGMAFGIRVADNTFFTVFALVASVAILVYLFKMQSEHFVARFALAIIFGGAVGNLSDRIIRGRVVDFFDFEFFDINIPPFQFLFVNFPGYSLDRWPVFNIADMAVSIGIVLLLIFVSFSNEQEELESKLPKETETEIIR